MRHRRGRGHAGETLLEILVTITILSIGIVAILTGIGTAVRLGGTHRNLSSADVALGMAAEAVKAAPAVACSSVTASSYAPVITAIASTDLPSGWTNSDLSIIDPTACDNASTLKLQTITIQATKGAQSESISVIKRSP